MFLKNEQKSRKTVFLCVLYTTVARYRNGPPGCSYGTPVRSRINCTVNQRGPGGALAPGECLCIPSKLHLLGCPSGGLGGVTVTRGGERQRGIRGARASASESSSTFGSVCGPPC